MVRCGDDGRDVLGRGGLVLGVEEVVTHGTRYHSLPVFLHEHIPANEERIVKEVKQQGNSTRAISERLRKN